MVTRTDIRVRPCVVPRGEKFMVCWDRWSVVYEHSDPERTPLVASSSTAILMDGLTREDLIQMREALDEALG